MTPSSSLYSIEDLRFGYAGKASTGLVLKGITHCLEDSAFVCLAGPSGSGKTTLLSILGLIESGWSGEVKFKGQSLKGMSEQQKCEIRLNAMGFVFQNFNLLPTLTSYENVEYFIRRQGVGSRERKARVEEALEQVGLADQRNKRPSEMSGGQRQRVSIARALAKKPNVIIADEPTASLDRKTAQQIMELFASINRATGVGIVIASHDPLVMAMVKQNIRLQDGLIAGEEV